ncbi:bacterioferritin-associated ferredoxin protein [Ralstonia solanacearum]|nr:bacterioferritin-associated ferredoxin protein [Ralstonia solanacearum]
MLPSAEDMALAREACRALSVALKTHAEVRQIGLPDGKGGMRTVSIPTAALCLLLEALTEIGQGNAVSIAPIHAELTTQEAASVLGISRPFLVQLLERGDIPFHKIGTHRRVRYQDAIDYKKRRDTERREALDALAAQAQEHDMGY